MMVKISSSTAGTVYQHDLCLPMMPPKTGDLCRLMIIGKQPRVSAAHHLNAQLRPQSQAVPS